VRTTLWEWKGVGCIQLPEDVLAQHLEQNR
jgi:hypothetical protein